MSACLFWVRMATSTDVQGQYRHEPTSTRDSVAPDAKAVEEIRPFVPPWWLRPLIVCVDGFGFVVLSVQQRLCPVKDKLGQVVEAHAATAPAMQAQQMSRTGSSAVFLDNASQSSGTAHFDANGQPVGVLASVESSAVNGSSKELVTKGSRQSRASTEGDASPTKQNSGSATSRRRRSSLNGRASTSRRNSRTSDGGADGGHGVEAGHGWEGPALVSPTTPGGRSLPPHTPGTSGSKGSKLSGKFKSTSVVPSEEFSSESTCGSQGVGGAGGRTPVRGAHVASGGELASPAASSVTATTSSAALLNLESAPPSPAIPRTPAGMSKGGAGGLESQSSDGKLKVNRRLSATTRRLPSTALQAQASTFSLH